MKGKDRQEEHRQISNVKTIQVEVTMLFVLVYRFDFSLDQEHYNCL